ncbi:CRP/FNR family transcriptional regulator [Algoriphagus aquaeductus]|uniref:CRP/FNR family transcriptional regulator n=1 Tax=Algoriphagus aquaeductus TaxID=475299 RepID=A0A326RXB6_9BACT|nr:CRP/FNR family transcriptional regulator [Algoriphagus aquaeductus]
MVIEEVKYWHIKNHQLFWFLNQEQIRQLCILANFKKAQKGEVLEFVQPGQHYIYLLKKGNLKVVQVDEEGNELIVDIIKQGELFGELESSGGKSNTYEYAQVLTDKVVLCRFSKSDFERLLLEFPQMALSYTKLVGLRLKKIQNRYSNLFFLKAKDRLVFFLKEWAESEGEKMEKGIKLTNYLTHKDIAQIICAARQTTTQFFNEWENEGVLHYSRKEIIIKDLHRLK